MSDAIVGAAGPGAGLALRAVLAERRLSAATRVVVVPGARLGAAPNHRAAVAEGPRGLVAVAVHGRPVRADGAGEAEVARGLAAGAVSGLDAGLPAAVQRAASDLDGDLAVLAVSPAARGALLALRRGRPLAVGEAERLVVAGSSEDAFPSGVAAVRTLDPWGCDLLVPADHPAPWHAVPAAA